MKSHRTKEQCYDNYLKRTNKLPSLEIYDVFVAGWYAAGNEINQGEDSDWLQELLYEDDFLKKDDE